MTSVWETIPVIEDSYKLRMDFLRLQVMSSEEGSKKCSDPGDRAVSCGEDWKQTKGFLIEKVGIRVGT